MQHDLTSNKNTLLCSQVKVALLVATLSASMLTSLPANAFSLGNLTTLSALGEPLRLEFEVLDLSPAETESLKVSLESPQSYASRGLGYGAFLEGMRLGLTRNAAGRWVIRMEGQRPATEAFIDLLLNITWASGSTIRAVSVLLTPQSGSSAAQSPRVAANVEPVALAPLVPAGPAPALEPLPAVVQANTAPSLASGSGAEQPIPSEAKSLAASKIIAKPGDTAGALAQRERPAGIDQSQYLLALVQANPSAFVEGNVNRLLAGAQLQLPTEAQAKVTTASEAKQIIATQWQEFQALRQQIAAKQPSLAPSLPSTPGAQAQGQVDSFQAAASAPSPADKLTLSKPSNTSVDKAEQALLDERQANDAKARLEELARTVRELNQLQANAGDGTNKPAAAEGTRAATTATPNIGSAAGPDLTAVTAPAPASKPVAGEGLIDRLADHPAVLPAAGGSLAMALAWLGWRLRRKSRGNADEYEPDLEGTDLNSSIRTQPNLEDVKTAPAPSRSADTATDLDLDLELDLDEETASSPGNPLTTQRRKAHQA